MLTRRAMLGRVGAAAGTAWAMRVGVAHAASRTALDFEIPRGACDCHVHVFGDPANSVRGFPVFSRFFNEAMKGRVAVESKEVKA